MLEITERRDLTGVKNSSPVEIARRNRLAPAFRLALVVEAAGGGVAVHIADMVRGLHAQGDVEVHLIVSTGARFDGAVIDQEVLARCHAIHRLRMLRSVGSADTVAFAQLFKCLRRIRPDIVHSHSSKAGALARLCIGPWKQIYTPHAVYTLNPYLPKAQRRFYGLIESFLGRFRTDRIIAVSLDEADHLREVLRIPEDRIETIFNGVPAPTLLPSAVARAALGLPFDSIIVGFVGRLDYQKGVDRLVRVAQELLKRGIGNVVFAVMGPGDFSASSGLGERSNPSNVHVLGPIADARRYFSAFDIFALPSRYEGFPYVVLEAMAAGIPIVTTRVSGAAELVEAEQIGFVVDNDDDVIHFADAIVALAQEPMMRERMSRHCRRAAECFSTTAMVEKTADLYKVLLKENC